MKIVDFDCIKTKEQAKIVNQWVFESCSFKKDENGNMIAIPIEAIYFFSTKSQTTIERFEKLGVARIGNFWKGPSIFSMLKQMIQGINDFKLKNGMKKIDRFPGKSPVIVLTNREMEKIEELNASPIPFDMIVGSHANL